MKIRYSKRRRFSNLVLGLAFTLTGALQVYEDTTSYFYYFQLFLGILLIGISFLERKNEYLKIENGLITKNSLTHKTIQLNKIDKIQSLPDKIKLFTSQEKLIINRGIIDDESIQDLYKVLGSLELDPQENPFIGYSVNRA